MGAYRHLQGDHLLRDSASWYSYTGDTEASNLDRTAAYAAAVTIRCMVAPASRRWQTRWPDAQLGRSAEIWLEHDSTITAEDKIVHRGTAYRVVDITDWQGAGRVALLEIMEGVNEG